LRPEGAWLTQFKLLAIRCASKTSLLTRPLEASLAFVVRQGWAIERDGDEAARASLLPQRDGPTSLLGFDGLRRLKRLSGICLPQYANMDLMLLTGRRTR
jgi:hypothetical protein